MRWAHCGDARVSAAAREKQGAPRDQCLQRSRAVNRWRRWLAPGYCMSKTALNGFTSQLATALPKFAVNSVCPGWVRTDMGGRSATRSVEEGADMIVWLATDTPQKVTGKFLRDRKEIPW
jgi:NAD(P)-dependent dehydrogenase (short-subunit alcohol dehydrogenase family)